MQITAGVDQADATTLQDAVAATANGTVLDVKGFGAVLAVITISNTATVAHEVSNDGTNWFAVKDAPVDGSTGATTRTATAAVVVPVAGWNKYRARVSAYSSGAVTVTGRGVVLPFDQRHAAGVGTSVALGQGVARAAEKMRSGNNAKVTFIGDSILEGNTATTPGTDDAASLICTTLASRFGVTVTKSNRAVSGYTTALALLNGVLTSAVADAADVYVISFGHNDLRSDSSTPGTGYPKAAMAGAYEHMIRRLRREVPFADIIILLQNPYTSGSGSNAYLQAQNVLLRNVAAAYGCELVDTYTAFTDLGDWSGYLSDGAHPNSAGHAVIANAVLARFPATAQARPVAPLLPESSLYQAYRYDRRGWTEITANAHSANTDALVLTAGGWSGSLPWVSSTVNDVVDFHFIGSECLLRIDCGAGTGAVRINVDGVYNPDPTGSLDLTAYPAGQRYIPITGLHMGVHRIQLTVLSGTITVRGFDILKGAAEFIPVESTRLTFGGSWAAAAGAGAHYSTRQRTSQTAGFGDTVAFDFVGTGWGVNILNYPTSHNLNVTQDGTAIGNVSIAYGSGVGTGSTIVTGRVVQSGLPFGRHSISFATVSSRQAQLGGIFVFDETRLVRPRRQAGIALVGETVVYAVPYSGRPFVRTWPLTTDTGDVRPSSGTATGFTVSGTASELAAWEAEGELVAY